MPKVGIELGVPKYLIKSDIEIYDRVLENGTDKRAIESTTDDRETEGAP